jgi:uncharacterized protein YjbJ (UPF0337 family)
MNAHVLEGNWNQFKGKIQEQWGKFTHDEYNQAAGNRKQLIGRIQELYGIKREEAERQLSDWERRVAA